MGWLSEDILRNANRVLNQHDNIKKAKLDKNVSHLFAGYY